MAYFRVRPWYAKKSGGIYGVVWDGSSSSAWTRTDDAVGFSVPVPQMSDGNGGWTTGSSPFDNIMPWKGMVKVEDTNAGTLVAIPKFYFKLDYADPTATVKGLKIQISENQFEGSQVSPAHMDRGDGNGERDVVYIGRYHCAVDTYKSTTGVSPQSSKTRSQFRENIHNLGSNIWQWDYATLLTIQMLYLVEFADWDSQNKVGYGCGSKSRVGSTDAMTYHTGTTGTALTTTGTTTQYRYIEDLWGASMPFYDGVYFVYSSSKINMYAIKNPASFSDSSGGTNVGAVPSASDRYIKAYNISSANGFAWLMYPAEVINSIGYICDRCSFSSSGVVLRGGGGDTSSPAYGLFYLLGTNNASFSSLTSSRLMKLP